jgi:hypothetical protein
MKLLLYTAALLLCIAMIASCKTGGLFVPVVSTNYVSDRGGLWSPIVSTNYAVNPALTNAFSAANDLSKPFPWNGVVQTITGAALAVLGVFAKRKSNQAALVPALVDGVETANNSDVKKAIETAAIRAGVQHDLHKTVKRLTG